MVDVACLSAEWTGIRICRIDNADVLHHSLVLVVQDVAMQNKVAREIFIVRSNDDMVPLLDQHRVPEHADLITVLRVGVRLRSGTGLHGYGMDGSRVSK